MEWNKIEKDWSKKLNQREMTPPDSAWNKIAQGLDKHESKVKKIYFKKWLSLAACLLLGSFVITQILQQEAVPETNIETTVEQQNLPDNKIVDINEEIKTEIQHNDILPDKENKVAETTKKQVKTKRVKEEVVQIQETAIAEINKEEISTEKNIPILKEVKIELPTSAVNQKVIVDSDLLLQQVEKEIETEYRDSKIKKIIDTAKKAVVYISESNYEK